MIDLNRKSKTVKDETPIGVVIIGLMPFALLLFWGMINVF